MSVVNQVEQVFPDVDRVIYRKAPLIEVVCQVRFPADLRIEANPPVDFQQRVREAFPMLDQKTESVVSGLPSELLTALEKFAPTPPTGTTTTWQFSTEDHMRSLELNKDKLTFICRDYQRWEEFFATYKVGLKAFFDEYKPKFLTRVGLRYRDLILRSSLNLSGVSWSKLLKPHVLGELAREEIGQRAQQAFRTLLLSLPEKGAKVQLQHGFAERKGNDEQGYLIDCDFFVERTEVADSHESINYLHEQVGRYFRWCITERLHRALEPEPIRGN